LAPDSFATGMDWVLEKTVAAMHGVSFGQYSFTDLDFADDVCLLAEMLGLLVPALETMASEDPDGGSAPDLRSRLALRALAILPPFAKS